ncbi:MAG TPA: isochorismatase family cysteine hydrolase [Candidatus Dormibacteraeota bacterium]|jgi:ureidoacrylate peracid hydrolase|nr:isochorismatase family cysteine hydrolase [Candidatus Dormibacteraeota bacterium]
MHQISIPDPVLDAIRRQRGKLLRFERLVGPRSALVVIDLQNCFMLPGMPVEVPTAREIVPNVNRLAAAVRSAGGVVVWLQMTLEGQRESWSVFFAGDERRATLEQLTPGAPGHELYAGLDVQPADLVVRKTRYSAFIQGSSDLDQRLRARGVDTVIIVGTLTNVCCESSARDAMMLNYRVVFVSDANAALSDAEHNATLATVFRTFGDVETTDEVIARLVSADREPAASGTTA